MYQFNKERPLVYVPLPVIVLLLLVAIAQAGFHQITREGREGEFNQLPFPPDYSSARLAGFSDPIATGRFLMLKLQAYDAQPGISVSYKNLDYQHLTEWLQLILHLDPSGLYPLFAASRLYAEVADESRQRQMLEFIYNSFLDNPDLRWPAMAHAIYIAKHKLKDLDLALHYANELTTHVKAESVPYWIKQMHIYVLEDMGDLEGAMVLMGGLLESGQINDEQEIRFLQYRIQQLKEKTGQD